MTSAPEERRGGMRHWHQHQPANQTQTPSLGLRRVATLQNDKMTFVGVDLECPRSNESTIKNVTWMSEMGSLPDVQTDVPPRWEKMSPRIPSSYFSISYTFQHSPAAACGIEDSFRGAARHDCGCVSPSSLSSSSSSFSRLNNPIPLSYDYHPPPPTSTNPWHLLRMWPPYFMVAKVRQFR